MAATDAQKNFAQSRIEYFHNALKGGEDDRLKSLVDAVSKKAGAYSIRSAKSIAEVIRMSAKEDDHLSKEVIYAATKFTGRGNYDSYQEQDFKKDVAEAFKSYDFINTILYNIPHKGTNVLKIDTAAKKFTGYIDNIRSASDDVKNAAKAYHKISLAVCGSIPFAEGDDIPQPKLKVQYSSNYVKECMNQFNKVTYTLLEDERCGKDKLDCFRVDERCYYALADKLYDLYNHGSIKDMKIDISDTYLYDAVVTSSVEVEVPKVAEHEVNECLRNKKKELKKSIEAVIKASGVSDGLDLEGVKYNDNMVKKQAEMIKEKKNMQVEEDKKREIEDWLLYAKKQMEEKDKEIRKLREELESYKQKEAAEGKEIVKENNIETDQKNGHMDL